MESKFTIAHVPGKINTAADFLYRLEMNPTEKEKVVRKKREEIPKTTIEVNIASIGIARDEPVFLTPQTSTRSQKKNSENLKKHELPYQTIQKSSKCRVITLMTFTKTQ